MKPEARYRLLLEMSQQVKRCRDHDAASGF
jgi:hypothetical protein